MSRTGLTLVIASMGMWGCTGHLDFDPRLLDASAGQVVNPGGNQGAGGKGSGNNMVGNMGMGGAGGDPYPTMPPPPPPPPPDAQQPTPMWADAGAGGSTGTSRDAGAPPDTAPAAPACPTGFDVLTAVFKNKCGACHGAAAPAVGLDLGTRTVNKPAACGGRMLINTQLGANNKPTGMLFDKLAGAVSGCGGQMPAGAPPLSASEMACVNEWAIGAINKALGR
jgi:hypothetical protein